MNIDALRASPIGQLVPVSGVDARTGAYDYYAFLPDPLPDEPGNITVETWNAVAESMGALGRLHQACVQLPNPSILIVPALLREAVSTSALEGTYAPISDVLEARLIKRPPGSAEVAEIRAYEGIAWDAFQWVRDRPITVNLLNELQGRLARELRRPSRDPGKIREHQVYIGPEDSPIYEARFVPPPPGDSLRARVEAWRDWVEQDRSLPIVLRAAMAHYQFETIHPYGDGNGRIGRLVIILQLMRAGTLPEPALSISPWLVKRRSEYQDHLLRVSETGDWNPWAQFFCQALSEQAEAHVNVTERIVSWLRAVRQQLNERRWSGTIVQLANDLIDWPMVTMRFTADKYDVSVPTAKSAIDRLVEIGVLEEMTGKRYGRVFGATEVIKLVESL